MDGIIDVAGITTDCLCTINKGWHVVGLYLGRDGTVQRRHVEVEVGDFYHSRSEFCTGGHPRIWHVTKRVLSYLALDVHYTDGYVQGSVVRQYQSIEGVQEM